MYIQIFTGLYDSQCEYKCGTLDSQIYTCFEIQSHDSPKGKTLLDSCTYNLDNGVKEYITYASCRPRIQRVM